MLLYSEAPNLHTHTLKVAVVDTADYDGEFTFELFRDTLLGRLHLLDALRYQLVDIPWRLHHPMWLENCDVDLDYHLRRARVPAPGGRRELDRVIGEIASTPLDRGHPLWEFHFAEGMADHRFALIGKVHHALADGIASANLLGRIMDPDRPVQDERDTRASGIPPSKPELLWTAARDHVQQIVALPGVIADAVSGLRRLWRGARERGAHPDLARLLQAPPTFINHVVSPERRNPLHQCSVEHILGQMVTKSRQARPVEQVQQCWPTGDGHHQSCYRSADFRTTTPGSTDIVGVQANPA